MNLILKKLIASATCMSCLFTTHAQMDPREKMAKALKTIQDNYVDSIPEEQLSDAAITGMIQILDPHSRYFSREEAGQMHEAMSGSFIGIGIQYLMQHDTVFVTQVTDGGPAQQAGVMAGDGIVDVDGRKIQGKGFTNYDIMKMIRGEKGTAVTLTIHRNAAAELFTVRITRNAIAERSVRSAYMIDANTGYIGLRIFSQTTRKEIDSALLSLKSQKMKNLILDLQGNGGGLVQEAIGVADEFLKKDQMVFYSIGNDHGKDYYYTGGYGQFAEGRLVVLIDQNTASASEILSGALQDWDRAVLVGRRSFGKGLMQKGFALADGSMLELTGARYYTPSGRSIQKPYHGAHYDDNIATRLASGELFDPTVIHFPDSLACSTLVNKRKVYGGGGIMPDRYVPVDSIEYSAWFQRLSGAGWITQTVFDYVNEHRTELSRQFTGFSDFRVNFTTPEYMLTALQEKSAKNAIVSKSPPDAHGRQMVALEIKAMIAMQLYGNNQYYDRILNDDNESFRQALAIISDPAEYARYLTGKQPVSKK